MNRSKPTLVWTRDLADVVAVTVAFPHAKRRSPMKKPEPTADVCDLFVTQGSALIVELSAPMETIGTAMKGIRPNA